MTRVFIDTRSYRGCWVAAHAAGLCDLDAVALVAGESTSAKLLSGMRTALRKVSTVSKISAVEIPCHTVDAIDVVKGLARPGDVIVTDSAPFASEFLQRGGEATDTFGERYTPLNTPQKVRYFYACQELKRQGINPYKPRAYRSADCKRLLATLKEIFETACGLEPRDTPLKFHHRATVKTPAKPLSVIESERGSDPKVFVDGDACPRLPAILEICGSARVPIVFVSNLEVDDLAGLACRKDPGFRFSAKALPDMAIEKVQVKKNAADRFIERHIAPGDIVLTDDTNLTAKCLNKGALAIDYRGRVLGLASESETIGRKGVQRMKQASSTGRKKKSRENAFRTSLRKAVG